MPQIITTEPLARMIQSITQHRRTGVLYIERLQGKSAERGEMHFESGSLVSVRTGREAGKAALQSIGEWKQITCNFQSMNPTYPRSAPITVQEVEASGERTQARRLSTSLPETDRLTRLPAEIDARRNEPPRDRNTHPLNPHQAEVALSAGARASMPSISGDSGEQALVLHGTRLEAYMPAPSSLPTRSVQRWTTHQMPETGMVQPPATPRLGLLPGEEVLPGRSAIFKVRATVSTAEAIAQMERRARIVFILLDGRRTIQDIARLTHQTEGEVEQTLVNLTQHGYTQYIRG